MRKTLFDSLICIFFNSKLCFLIKLDFVYYFQCEKSPLDEACCQEVMEERNIEYNEEFEGLHETLDILKQNIRK